MMELKGKKVVVMGLGRFGGGVGVTRWLVGEGADVLVTDRCKEEDLRESLRELEGLGVKLRLGEHLEEDFEDADIVVVNPAVPRKGNRYVRAAERGGTKITSEIELLIERLPNKAHVVAVTGTAGKSTVCAMLGRVLNRVGGRCWVGGNIGGSLLGCLEEMRHEDWVVLELSSFMLEGLREAKLDVGVAVVTSFSMNHLDWHGNEDAYRDAKQVLLAGQGSDGVAVMGQGVRKAGLKAREDVDLVEVDEKDGQDLEMVLPGEHNRMNGAIVKVVCEKVGVWGDDAKKVVEEFEGLDHRMQYVGEVDGVRYYNDSKCTTVNGAVLAMHSFGAGCVHVILGGYDKGDRYESLGFEAGYWCKGIYTIGDMGERIAKGAMGGRGVLVRCETLEVAMRRIKSRAEKGDVVLLSPGCASWDQFSNFQQRGERFVELAKGM